MSLFVVRYESMIGSYLGETAARLSVFFYYARTIPCVLFFDEFDAVGKERGDIHQTGEIKRVVTSLLMQIDELPAIRLWRPQPMIPNCLTVRPGGVSVAA